MLFQRLGTAFYLPLGKIFFNPSVFVKDLIVILGFVNPVEIKQFIRPGKMPSFRIKGEILEVFGKRFDGLGGNKAADLYSIDCYVIKLPVCF